MADQFSRVVSGVYVLSRPYGKNLGIDFISGRSGVQAEMTVQIPGIPVLNSTSLGKRETLGRFLKVPLLNYWLGWVEVFWNQALKCDGNDASSSGGHFFRCQ